RYTTQHALEHQPTRVMRPRVLIYAGLLSALVVGFVLALAVGSPGRLAARALEAQPPGGQAPGVLISAGLLSALVVGFVVALAMRSPVSLDVLRDRNSLYRLTDDGQVDNVYTLRILNKTEK